MGLMDLGPVRSLIVLVLECIGLHGVVWPPRRWCTTKIDVTGGSSLLFTCKI